MKKLSIIFGCLSAVAITVLFLALGAEGQVLSRPGVPAAGGTFTGPVTASSGLTASTITTTAVSGAVGIQGVTGQTWCMGTNGTACFTSNGTIISTEYMNVSAQVYSSMFTAWGANPFMLAGGGISNGTGVALKVFNQNTLALDGDLIATFAPDINNTVKLSIDKDGMLRFGVGNTGAAPTCAAAQRGKIWIVNGGTGVTDTVTLCLKSAANTYSWVTLTTGG